MIQDRSGIPISVADLGRLLLHDATPAYLLAAASAAVYVLVGRKPSAFRAEATLLVASR